MSEVQALPEGRPDTPGVVIRPVRPEEYSTAAAVLVTAYDHDYTLTEEYRENLSSIEHWATTQQVWVAVDTGSSGAGSLLGLVITPRPDGPPIAPLARPGELDFRLLAVHPDARRRGIGELLTRHVIDLARFRGSSAVVMNSGPEMRAAHRLYERLGFTRLEEREDRWVQGPAGPIRLLAFGYPLD